MVASARACRACPMAPCCSSCTCCRRCGPAQDGGSRFGIVLNGSPLFTGGAGSGESEIRRYVLENDLVEAIIGLPTDMFYNTGISTYVWIVSNRKPAHRKGKAQLIDASCFWRKMRKSLGSKRKEMSDEHIADVTRLFGSFVQAQLATVLDAEGKEVARAVVVAGETAPQAPEGGKVKLAPLSRIFPNEAFGYRTITVERPLRDEKGKIVLGAKGKQKGKPQADSALRDTENVPLSEDGGDLFQARGSAPCARRLDRRREDQGWIRNPVQPAFLCVRAAAPARRNRRRFEAGDGPHQGDDRRARGMSFPRYETYKDSGVEWLGEVPRHWEIKPLRRCLLEHRQGYYSSDGYVDDGVRLLRITDIHEHAER